MEKRKKKEKKKKVLVYLVVYGTIYPLLCWYRTYTKYLEVYDMSRMITAGTPAGTEFEIVIYVYQVLL